METIAVRLHGANDLRLDRFELPEISDDEILADVTSNGICMSSYKATCLGADHKRVPDDVAENPIMMGHEFCGTILKVGANWQEKFNVGDKYGIQPQLNYPGREHIAPGYSFPYTGGQAAKIIIPKEVLEMDCLLPYDGEAFFFASLAESFSCVIGAFNTNYHFETGSYKHINGIVKGGAMALIAGAGPMGIAAIDYAIHGDQRPGLLVVTDIDQARLDRVADVLSSEDAKEHGVDLRYINTSEMSDPVAELRAMTEDSKGYDDAFVFAPVPPLIGQASALLGFNGCLNFFAGPSNTDFSAPINFYDVHYMGHHVVGSSGGNTDDMLEALRLMGEGRINPGTMVTHIGGLDSAAATIQDLPNVPGGRKLIYTQLSFPLTAIDDFEKLGESDALFAGLAEIVKRGNMLWSLEAEQYLLANGTRLLDS